MGICTILTEMTMIVLFKVLAHLCLVVVVGDVEHFVLYFYRQALYVEKMKRN